MSTPAVMLSDAPIIIESAHDRVMMCSRTDSSNPRSLGVDPRMDAPLYNMSVAARSQARRYGVDRANPGTAATIDCCIHVVLDYSVVGGVVGVEDVF